MKKYNRHYLKHYRPEFTVFAIFFFVALTITVLHLFFHPIRVLGMNTSIFYMDEKYTLAAFFSTVTAFLVGYVALTNIINKESKLKWLADIAYGLFFIILAFDEYFEVHEYTNTLIKAGTKEEGILKNLSTLSWIFPLFLVIVAVFVLLIAKMKLTNKLVRKPMMMGILCFALVLVFELLGSMSYGKDIYVYYVAVEEGLEMVGTSFFLMATLIEKKLVLNLE